MSWPLTRDQTIYFPRPSSYPAGVRDRQAWDRIASLARLAPTPHNTQPFRIRPRGDRADLVMLSERLLPREDHGNLYVPASFGTFLGSLERAAAHLGYAITTEAVPALDTAALTCESGPVLVGHAALTGTCAAQPQQELLEARRTSRLPYEDREVAQEVVAAMSQAVERGGHRFLSRTAPEEVAAVLRANAEAILDNLQIDDEREEIRAWSRFGPTPELGDGLWQEVMNQPAWELRSAFAVPRLFVLPGIRQVAVRRYLATQRGTRHVALVCGAFRAWPDLVAAGRMLLDLWLTMAQHRVSMQPFGSMLTNPRYATWVAERFGAADGWLLFRFGHSDVPVRAPRLPSIVLDE